MTCTHIILFDSESLWNLLERLTSQAVENILEAEKMCAKTKLSVREDKAVQAGESDLRSSSSRLLRRSGGFSGKTGHGSDDVGVKVREKTKHYRGSHQCKATGSRRIENLPSGPDFFSLFTYVHSEKVKVRSFCLTSMRTCLMFV